MFAGEPFIEPDQLLKKRDSKVLTPLMLEQKAKERLRQTQFYKDQLARVLAEDATSPDFIESACTEEVPTSQVAVWIDPIDGTKAFADGHVD